MASWSISYPYCTSFAACAASMMLMLQLSFMPSEVTCQWKKTGQTHPLHFIIHLFSFLLLLLHNYLH